MDSNKINLISLANFAERLFNTTAPEISRIVFKNKFVYFYNQDSISFCILQNGLNIPQDLDAHRPLEDYTFYRTDFETKIISKERES